MYASNILVTGALGFIGSNFVNYFAKKYPKINIIILDKNDYCSSIDNIEKNNVNVKIIIGNILDCKCVDELLHETHIDTIIHFAAQSHVDNSFCNSIAFTENNILGTHKLLETTRIYHEKTNLIQKFIHVSTDEVYGEVLDDTVRTETSILDPTNPYAASKAGAEFIAKSYYHSYKIPIIITRANNVYGINQYPEKVIPKFICQLLNNEKITLHGTGASRRNFIHVDDVSTAYETILLHGKIGEVYNISAADKHEYSMMELAQMLINLSVSRETEYSIHPFLHNEKKLDDMITYVEDRKFNDIRYYTSSEKLEQLGWKPIKIDFKNNLEELIKWYADNKSRYE
jgi:dTDP-glucose 4,6-dehydratase